MLLFIRCYFCVAALLMQFFHNRPPPHRLNSSLCKLVSRINSWIEYVLVAGINVPKGAATTEPFKARVAHLSILRRTAVDNGPNTSWWPVILLRLMLLLHLCRWPISGGGKGSGWRCSLWGIYGLGTNRGVCAACIGFGGKMQKGFVSFTVVAPGSLSFLCQFNFMSSVLLCGWSLVVSLSLWIMMLSCCVTL